MNKSNTNKILKKWTPILGIVAIIVITMGLIFHSSFPQIISSIIASVILILSAMFFKSVGRDRESKKNNYDTEV